MHDLLFLLCYSKTWVKRKPDNILCTSEEKPINTALMNGNNLTHSPKYKTVFHRVGVQTFDDKGPYSLLWAGSRFASGKITVNGLSNRLSHCVICIVYT